MAASGVEPEAIESGTSSTPAVTVGAVIVRVASSSIPLICLTNSFGATISNALKPVMTLPPAILSITSSQIPLPSQTLFLKFEYMSSTPSLYRSSSAGERRWVTSEAREPRKKDSRVMWRRSKKDWRKVGRRAATPMLLEKGEVS